MDDIRAGDIRAGDIRAANKWQPMARQAGKDTRMLAPADSGW